MASSARRDRSTTSRAKGPWSARLSRSSASVRSMARALIVWRRSTSSAGVAARVLACDVEERLRHGQRRAQLVRGVGGEPLLLGDLRLEPSQHAVEGVGELAELVVTALELDPVSERSARGSACGVRDARQGGEHPSGEEPAADEAEHEQERERLDRPAERTRPGGRSESGWRGRARRSRGRARIAGGTPTPRRAAGRRRSSGSRHS